MKKNQFVVALLGAVLSISLFAEEKTAEELVKSMKKEDITYRQLMNGMAMAKNNIDNGIIGMNKMLVNRGIDFIRTHPAPRAKPWVIMGKDDQEGFKSMLVFYDKKMDEDVEAIEKAVNKKDWQKALEASNELSNSCLSCHVVYKDKVKYIME
jgi:cytochrome c556